MDVISHLPSSTSTLNPHAPLFVPLSYRTVEDFSDQWWALVQSSPCFRDYWLQDRYLDPQNDPAFPDNYESALPDDLYSLFFDDYLEPNYTIQQEEEDEREYGRDLVSVGAMRWKKGHGLAKSPKYMEKVPKIVNVKVSPRTIQQPR